MQRRSQSSSAHRASRPADKGGADAGVNFPFCFFLGRLGLGNEDDCAAPQKVIKHALHLNVTPANFSLETGCTRES